MGHANDKVAGYIRTSTTDQTTEQQRQAIRDAYPDDTDIVWYEDQESAWSGKERKEYEAVKQGIVRGRIKELCVFSVSRLGRNVQEAARLLTSCQTYNVKV